MSAKLRKAVYLAAKRAFATVREKHPNEKFYVFGLMTNDAAQYLFPLSNTEQALKKTVKKYRDEGYKDQNADTLRWSFGDWNYGIWRAKSACRSSIPTTPRSTAWRSYLETAR